MTAPQHLFVAVVVLLFTNLAAASDDQLHPRRLQAQSPSSKSLPVFTVPLYFGLFKRGSQQWFIPATVGKSAVNLTFDTGSNPVYVSWRANYSPSSAGVCGTKLVNFTYHSGPIYGVYCNDTVQVGNNQNIKVSLRNYPFLKVFKNSSKEANSKQGNMGWGLQVPSVFETLVNSGAVKNNSNYFSTWMAMNSKKVGQLVVGGVNKSTFSGNRTWATVIPNSGQRSDVARTFVFWMFNMNAYLKFYNNKIVPLCMNCTAIADSGTGGIDSNPAHYAQIQAGYNMNTPNGCLSSLIFQFDGGNITMPLTSGAKCQPIIPLSSFGTTLASGVVNPGAWMTLGAPFTSSFHTIWDRGNKRIGFANPVPNPWLS